MSPLDYAVIVVYFAAVMGVGLWCRRAAARNLDSYFLGGNRIHWLALAMSGSVATFDITGTMWIVTLITLFGMKSMWNHWMWGFLMAAFFMSYMGKWVRRSRVVTGAEWMVTRFGDGAAGRSARIAYSILAIVTLVGFIGYAFQGIGKFATVYIDLGPLLTAVGEAAPALSRYSEAALENQPAVLAIAIFSITTLYVLLGGLYGVVATNVLQTVILTLAGVLIAALAYAELTPDMIAAALPRDGTSMTSLMPQWRLQHAAQLPTEYAVYELFGALVIMWVVKGLLLNLGGPGQMTDFQIFLATRSPRDAAKLGAAWSGFLVVRWAMCMGIALLALTGLTGVDDPEQVMPMVLEKFLPSGVRGLVIAGLLAAFMSTFGATVNAAASYIVRDFWQPLVPGADERHLVRVSYGATLGVVVAGTAIGFQADSIRAIWDWIMMAVGAAFVVPNVLRWYWWRLNGFGYAMGTLVGLIAALLVPLIAELNLPYIAFPVVCAFSVIGCLVGTYLTAPTDRATLVAFYRSVRPFGRWEPIRKRSGLSPEELADPAESAWLAGLNLVLAGLVILGAYLSPMYLVGHWHAGALAWLALAVAAAVPLFFTWYRNLPAAE